MKKVLKLIVAIIIALAVIGGVSFLIDSSSIKSGKEPIIALAVNTWDDGGTTEYMGLGYKIIDFNSLTGYDEVKIMPWFMSDAKFLEEYEKYNKEYGKNNNVEIIKPADDEKSGDTLIENISGDISISGDDEIIEIVSGDVEAEIVENVSGDEENTNVNSGDATIEESGDIDTEVKNENIFTAVVIGVNNNNLVVQALENEAITTSADMFSFSINETNNASATEFIIGQKVEIEYTGTIAESYPAQIEVTQIKVIE